MDRDEVLRKLRERIVAYAASRISRDAAEDLAQEALMVLHEKYAHLSEIEDLLPLSLQIVRFKMMAQRRKAARRGESSQVSVTDVPLPDDSASPEVLAGRRMLLDRLATAIGQMDGRCREMIRLKLEGRTFPEIQKILKAASINTVYTWDHRCRKRLLELMGGSWEERA